MFKNFLLSVVLMLSTCSQAGAPACAAKPKPVFQNPGVVGQDRECALRESVYLIGATAKLSAYPIDKLKALARESGLDQGAWRTVVMAYAETNASDSDAQIRVRAASAVTICLVAKAYRK